MQCNLHEDESAKFTPEPIERKQIFKDNVCYRSDRKG